MPPRYVLPVVGSGVNIHWHFNEWASGSQLFGKVTAIVLREGKPMDSYIIAIIIVSVLCIARMMFVVLKRQ